MSVRASVRRGAKTRFLRRRFRRIFLFFHRPSSIRRRREISSVYDSFTITRDKFIRSPNNIYIGQYITRMGSCERREHSILLLIFLFFWNIRNNELRKYVEFSRSRTTPVIIISRNIDRDRKNMENSIYERGANSNTGRCEKTEQHDVICARRVVCHSRTVDGAYLIVLLANRRSSVYAKRFNIYERFRVQRRRRLNL